MTKASSTLDNICRTIKSKLFSTAQTRKTRNKLYSWNATGSLKEEVAKRAGNKDWSSRVEGVSFKDIRYSLAGTAQESLKDSAMAYRQSLDIADKTPSQYDCYQEETDCLLTTDHLTKMVEMIRGDPIIQINVNEIVPSIFRTQSSGNSEALLSIMHSRIASSERDILECVDVQDIRDVLPGIDDKLGKLLSQYQSSRDAHIERRQEPWKWDWEFQTVNDDEKDWAKAITNLIVTHLNAQTATASIISQLSEDREKE